MSTTTLDDGSHAREIGALVAKGMVPNEIASIVDLPLSYVNSLTTHDEFRAALKKFGGQEGLDRWDEYVDERRAKSSLRTRVRENMDTYFDILHELAMDEKVKSETRFSTIKFLFEGSGILKEEAPPPQVQELPQSFFTAQVAAEREMDE